MWSNVGNNAVKFIVNLLPLYCTYITKQHHIEKQQATKQATTVLHSIDPRYQSKQHIYNNTVIIIFFFNMNKIILSFVIQHIHFRSLSQMNSFLMLHSFVYLPRWIPKFISKAPCVQLTQREGKVNLLFFYFFKSSRFL